MVFSEPDGVERWVVVGRLIPQSRGFQKSQDAVKTNARAVQRCNIQKSSHGHILKTQATWDGFAAAREGRRGWPGAASGRNLCVRPKSSRGRIQTSFRRPFDDRATASSFRDSRMTWRAPATLPFLPHLKTMPLFARARRARRTGHGSGNAILPSRMRQRRGGAWIDCTGLPFAASIVRVARRIPFAGTLSTFAENARRSGNGSVSPPSDLRHGSVQSETSRVLAKRTGEHDMPFHAHHGESTQ